MGVFTQRPEEDPADWTGLPAEPLDPLSQAEKLGDAPQSDLLELGLGVELGSIAIPLGTEKDSRP